MKKKILVAFQTIQEGWDELEEHFDLTFPPEGRDFTPEEIRERVGEYDALLSVFDIPIDKEIIEAGKQLQLISNYAVGFNNIDIEAARAKGVAVTNTPHSVVEPTADLAMAHLLNCARNISSWTKRMRQEREGLHITRISDLGIGLQGKVLGILGWGNIGSALARRAQACGMTILYNKRNRLDPDEEKRLHITYADRETLLSESDVVSLHTPLTEETHHIINAESLRLMRPGTILINTGRGPLVDEAALIDALKSGNIAGAGLDVFEHNDIPSPELYEMDNVSLTPHIGTQTYEARLRMLQELTNNVIGYFEGGREVSRVV